ncbi:site-specific integrase [Labilibaculum sp. K2S]|uniref:site-specific integrase n=1 Tax=Labilibaculum sp. K2S TaxID=3056386 RepID=UPI0025A38032|nr:site-specific integrase [Labilibaculum sp. K2S]MDM8159853.1 site-specific integrase [Labilibaculum sp. K2S]
MSIKIHLSADTHRNKKIVVIQLDYSTEILNLLKVSFPTRWSQTKKCWWIARTDFDYKKFKEVFTSDEIIITDQKTSITSTKKDTKFKLKLPKGYLEKLEQKRYSPQTIKIYTSYFNDFQKHFSDKNLLDITTDETNTYILQLIKTKNISASQQNQRINAIKFYYEKVLGKDRKVYKIDRANKAKYCPPYLANLK